MGFWQVIGIILIGIYIYNLFLLLKASCYRKVTFTVIPYWIYLMDKYYDPKIATKIHAKLKPLLDDEDFYTKAKIPFNNLFEAQELKFVIMNNIAWLQHYNTYVDSEGFERPLVSDRIFAGVLGKDEGAKEEPQFTMLKTWNQYGDEVFRFYFRQKDEDQWLKPPKITTIYDFPTIFLKKKINTKSRLFKKLIKRYKLNYEEHHTDFVDDDFGDSHPIEDGSLELDSEYFGFIVKIHDNLIL